MSTAGPTTILAVDDEPVELQFITLVLATIDPEAEMLHFVNAGHNPAYLDSATGLEQLQSHGLPIGILPGTIYRAQTRRFPAGKCSGFSAPAC